VENCRIDGGFTFDGISCDSRLVVQDTVIRSVQVGIRVHGSNPTAVIDSVTFQNVSGNAVLALDNAKVSVRNSVANTGSFYAFAAHNTAEMNLENCAAMNFRGVIAPDVHGSRRTCHYR
jgi:hypothetical protein